MNTEQDWARVDKSLKHGVWAGTALLWLLAVPLIIGALVFVALLVWLL